jgi:hypothetical protein
LTPSVVAQLVLVAVLLVLAGFTIPALLQVKRTARAVEEFVRDVSPGVRSATTNLDSVLGRVDSVMGSVETGTRGLTGALSGLGAFVGNLRPPVPGGSPAASWLAAIASLLSGFVQAWSARSAKPETAPRQDDSNPEGGKADV